MVLRMKSFIICLQMFLLFWTSIYNIASTSNILTSTEFEKLEGLVKLNLSSSYLVYSANKENFSSLSFHQHCDKFSGTFIIIKSSSIDENGLQNNQSFNIFGGFTKQNWSGKEEWKRDETSFLFSYKNSFGFPVLMNIKNPDCAIFADKYSGPNFGCGSDLFIKDEQGDSDLGETYQAPEFITTLEESQLFLANSYRFNVEEIEVYTFEDPCSFYPCENNGKCSYIKNIGYRCECPLDSFGENCKFKRVNESLFHGTQILSNKNASVLMNLIELDPSSTFELIYRRNSTQKEDDFVPIINKYQGSILVLVKDNYSSILGGYGRIDWLRTLRAHPNEVNEIIRKVDRKSFLFLLTNNKKLVDKYAINQNYDSQVDYYLESNRENLLEFGSDFRINSSHLEINPSKYYETNYVSASIEYSLLEIYLVNHKNPCKNNPCFNQGVCREVLTSYQCECTGNYQGQNCDYLGTNSVIFKNSTIIKNDLWLTTVFGNIMDSKPNLIYQAIRDGFGKSQMLFKTKGIQKKLILVKISTQLNIFGTTSQVFGAYSSQSWTELLKLRGTCINDDKSMFFIETNRGGQPLQVTQLSPLNQNDYYGKSEDDCDFELNGIGGSFCIGSRCMNKNPNTYYSYLNSGLDNSRYFVTEIEIYELNIDLPQEFPKDYKNLPVDYESLSNEYDYDSNDGALLF